MKTIKLPKIITYPAHPLAEFIGTIGGVSLALAFGYHQPILATATVCGGAVLGLILTLTAPSRHPHQPAASPQRHPTLAMPETGGVQTDPPSPPTEPTLHFPPGTIITHGRPPLFPSAYATLSSSPAWDPATDFPAAGSLKERLLYVNGQISFHQGMVAEIENEVDEMLESTRLLKSDIARAQATRAEILRELDSDAAIKATLDKIVDQCQGDVS